MNGVSYKYHPLVKRTLGCREGGDIESGELLSWE